MKTALTLAALAVLATGCSSAGPDPATPTPTPSIAPADAVPGTFQTACYDDTAEIGCPSAGEPFFGQNGSYPGVTPSYTDNGDGTVTDDVTGLMWQQDPGDRVPYSAAISGAADLQLAGYDDWRVPTITELYSLTDFTGIDPSSYRGSDAGGLTPFIDTEVFAFEYPAATGQDPGAGNRLIDAQYVSSTNYLGTVFGNTECFFGFNFADGRIKCYPKQDSRGWYVRYVRGPAGYGENDFTDNGDGTVSDASTGLMWAQADSGQGGDWQWALAYCADSDLAGHDDWRLPDVKQLQGIVDYDRAPVATGGPALDPVFESSEITNEAGQSDYPAMWASTTFLSYPDNAKAAAYVSFGRALGFMDGRWLDVHGAGAQRSDPKTGDPSQYPQGFGPQGDAIRIDNYARCVRSY